MVHDQHVYQKYHVFVILFFFMSCSEPPMGISSVPWRFSNTFSSSFRCRKLALTKETSYFFILGVVGRHLEGCQASAYVWLSVCTFLASIDPSVCLYICQYFCVWEVC